MSNATIFKAATISAVICTPLRQTQKCAGFSKPQGKVFGKMAIRCAL